MDSELEALVPLFNGISIFETLILFLLQDGRFLPFADVLITCYISRHVGNG